MSRALKKVYGVLKPRPITWVGDGLPVHNLFKPTDFGKYLSPFLLLDYAAPYKFEPAEKPRGIGMHPHRGFETVTLVYSGGIAHKDTDGSGGNIGPGGLQWMTAGSGVMHEELHTAEFTKTGGTLEAIQLWVNLPRKDKYTDPFYQMKEDKDFPRVQLPNNSGEVRVVSGEFGDAKSPVNTFLPENIWDVKVPKNATAEFNVPDGSVVAVLFRRGRGSVNGALLNPKELVALRHDGTGFDIDAHEDVEAVVLTAPYLDEPIVSRGPFVTSTEEEMQKTREDYKNGVFHNLKPAKKC